MKHLLAAGAALTAVVLVSSGQAQAQKRNLVVAAAVADAGKLDPHQASAGADKGMLNWVFNALVRVKPGQASPEFIEPDLAESWSSNPAGTEWTFKIRAGVQCHVGGEFTAEDAAYSLQRSADKARSVFATDFAVLEKAEAVDKYTLKITLKNQIPSLLGLVANYHGGLMVCKKAAEEAGENFGKKPIGTGPFMFVDYQPQQYVKLTANKRYFRGAPQLDEITYRYIPSDATRDLAFRTGEVDMVFGRQTDQWVARTKETPGARVAAMEPAELNMLHLNITAKPLDDIRVRQAIAHAIDRRVLIQFQGADVSREAISVIPNGNLGITKQTLPEFSVAKAKQLLTEAGYPNGITMTAIQSTLPSILRIMENVQAQLRNAGINLQIEPVDHQTYMAQIRKDLSPVTFYQAARFPVADVYLSQFFHSRSTVNTPTGIVNFSHCKSADSEIDAARGEPSVEKQKALWKTAQEKILKDLCGIPLSESLVIWAWRDSLDFGSEMAGSLNLVPHITEKTRFTK